MSEGRLRRPLPAGSWHAMLDQLGLIAGQRQQREDKRLREQKRYERRRQQEAACRTTS